MKKGILFVITSVFLVVFFCYKQKFKRPDPNFYKNLYTGEVLGQSEFKEFREKLYTNLLDTTKGKDYIDSIKNEISIHLRFYSLEYSDDSIIQPFNYDVRIGKEYLIRTNSNEKIGFQIPQIKFKPINNDSIQIGGVRDKPILFNLWFIACPGCIAEMPALNRLQELYADKVDFISLTFEPDDEVVKFLKTRKFNFIHITNAKNFIKEIGTKPYPENIFIDQKGYIKYIEGGLIKHEDLDFVIKHFETLLKDMLNL